MWSWPEQCEDEAATLGVGSPLVARSMFASCRGLLSVRHLTGERKANTGREIGVLTSESSLCGETLEPGGWIKKPGVQASRGEGLDGASTSPGLSSVSSAGGNGHSAALLALQASQPWKWSTQVCTSRVCLSQGDGKLKGA